MKDKEKGDEEIGKGDLRIDEEKRREKTKEKRTVDERWWKEQWGGETRKWDKGKRPVETEMEERRHYEKSDENWRDDGRNERIN